MSIKITSAAALQRMENAIMQANKAFIHNIELDIKEAWEKVHADMIRIRKLAMEKNKKHEEVKNAQIV